MARRIIALSFLGLFFLAACGDKGPDIQRKFGSELPEMWELDSFKVVASEDAGTKVSPVTLHRFIARVSPRQDLYDQVATVLDRPVLRLTHKKGKAVEVHGIATSAFVAGNWETMFNMENSPFYSAGRPATAFAANHVAIGSAGYRSLIKAAEAEMTALRDTVEKTPAEIARLASELNIAAAEAQEEIRKANEMLARIRQETQERNNSLYQSYTANTREISTRHSAEFTEKRNTLNAKFAEDKSALDSSHAARIAAIRAERTEAGTWRQTERRRVQTEYNAVIADARKKQLDAAGLAAERAAADARAKAEYDAIEAETRKRTDATRESEARATADYRAELERLQGVLREATAALTADVNGRRDGELTTAKQEYDAAVATTAGEVTAARNAHNTVVQSSNSRQNQLRNEINRLQSQSYGNAQRYQNFQQVLASLKQFEN